MRIVRYQASLLPALTDLLNDHLRRVPPGWTLSEAQVAQVMANGPRLWDLHYPDEPSQPDHQEILCVVENDSLMAAVGWHVYQAEERAALLNWIAADPDQPEALTLLLDTLIEHSQAAGAQVLDTSRYAFGIGWMGIPLVWPHLIDGFGAAGFTVTQQWRIMTGSADGLSQRPPPAIDAFSLAWRSDEAALEWVVEAFAGDAQIGECQASGVPPHLRDCPGYGQWTTVEWLGVEPAYQRRGIGAYLLGEQLRFQAARGVRQVMVWTETDNHAIQRLNAASGFSNGPECHVFSKSLAGAETAK